LNFLHTGTSNNIAGNWFSNNVFVFVKEVPVIISAVEENAKCLAKGKSQKSKIQQHGDPTNQLK
jgi:hypothetical protein